VPRVSGERIWHELERIGAEAFPERALHRLDQLGVLRAIDPALTLSHSLDVDFEQLRVAFGGPEPIANVAAWLGRVSAEAIDAITQRLRRSSAQRECVAQVRRWSLLEAELGDVSFTPSAIVRLLDSFDDHVLRVAQALMVNDVARARIALYRTHWREYEPLLNGTRLQELGIVPGPIYGQILSAVRAAQRFSACIVLKGSHSVVADPEGTSAI